MGIIHKLGVNYHDMAIRNLYRCYLQREIDDTGLHSYGPQSYDAARDSITNSQEYCNLVYNKVFDKTIDEKIDYTIIKVNDRAADGIKNLQSKLNEHFVYHDNLNFVHHQETNIDDFFQSRNINICWAGTLFGLLPTVTNSELAITASHLVALEYLVNSDLDKLIVFEDDVVLADKFVNRLACCMQDLPADYDFLADQTLEPHYQEIATIWESNIIGSNYISKSYLQNSHLGCTLYSKKGAQKILDLYRKHGVMCPVDTFIYWLARLDTLNGFSTFQSNRLLLTKDIYGTLVTAQRTQ